MARLRRPLITLSVTWFVFSFVCSSSARDDRHPRGVLGWARVLNQAAVQKELKLSAEQLKVVEGASDLLDRIRDGKAQSIAEKQLTQSLTAQQLTRLKQIHWQRLGGEVLYEREVSLALMITVEQKKQLAAARAINVAEHKKMLNFLARARFASKQALEAYKNKYRVAANKRLIAVLTPEQKKTLDQLLGMRFDL